MGSGDRRLVSKRKKRKKQYQDPALVKEIQKRMLGLVKEICEPEVSAQRKDLEVKGTALTGSQDLYFLKKQHLG